MVNDAGAAAAASGIAAAAITVVRRFMGLPPCFWRTLYRLFCSRTVGEIPTVSSRHAPSLSRRPCRQPPAPCCAEEGPRRKIPAARENRGRLHPRSGADAGSRRPAGGDRRRVPPRLL